MTTISLLIPDLIPSAAMNSALLSDLSLPALSILLARGKRNRNNTAPDIETALCQHFGITRQSDWPVAPITLQAEGGKPGAHYWLRADPVHLRATREQLMLVDSGAFEISQAEAAQFADAFNCHFQNDGYTLYPVQPKRWYLQVSHPPALTTCSINSVTGKSINAYLPSGPDGLAWHRFYNEIQMLFFSLPVNGARETRGELAINSLWCWGGGILPIIPACSSPKLWSNDSDARALATATQVDNATLPDHANTITDPALVILDQLSGAAQYGDYQGWREALLQLESNWFAPLLARLKSGQITSLQISTFTQQHAINWQIKSSDLYKLWRRSTITQSLTVPPVLMYQHS